MDIENKKIRCHYSIVLENCGKFITVIVMLIILNIGDFADMDFSNPDEIIAGLAVTGVLGCVLIIMFVILTLRWRKTTVTIEDDALVWERDTINRKVLTIGIKNISSINLEQSIFERIIKTAKLKIDTNSLSTADTTDINLVFNYEEALKYKEYLEEKVKALNGEKTEVNAFENGGNPENTTDISGGKAAFDNHIKTEGQIPQVSYTSDEKDIAMHCLYDLSITGLIFCIGSFVFLVISVVEAISQGISGKAGDIFVAVVTLFILFASALSSIVGKFFRYYKLTISRIGKNIKVKYGMFKICEYTIPVSKINAISINQTFIGRIFKRYNVTMECIGVGDDNNETAQLTLSLPLLEVIERVNKLLPEYSADIMADIKPVSAKAVYHKLCGLILLIPVAAGVFIGQVIYGNYFRDPLPGFVWAIEAAVLAFIIVWRLIVIFMQLKTEGLGIGENHMASSTGAFARRTVILSYNKIQYITIKMSPVNKFTGLYSGSAHILSKLLSTANEIPFMNKEQAEQLEEKIVYGKKCIELGK